VDVFLYFFEAKNPGKKLWMSFNGVVGRVLLTLFQQSYKGFKGKFFKICCSKHDPTLLDGFPLYWVEKPGLKKPRSLEDLTPPDREVCEFLSSLGVVFNTTELIKLEYNPKVLKASVVVSPFFCLYLSLLVCCVGLASHAILFSCADIVLNAEKRRQLAEVALQRKVAPSPSDANASAPADAPTTTISAPSPSAPAPIDHRQKGVVEATASEEKGHLFRPRLQEEENN